MTEHLRCSICRCRPTGLEPTAHKLTADPLSRDAALQAELDGMIAQFDGMLEAAGFFFPRSRADDELDAAHFADQPRLVDAEGADDTRVLSAFEKPRRRD